MKTKNRYVIRARVKAEIDTIPTELLALWSQGYELLYKNGYIYAISIHETDRKV